MQIGLEHDDWSYEGTLKKCSVCGVRITHKKDGKCYKHRDRQGGKAK